VKSDGYGGIVVMSPPFAGKLFTGEYNIGGSAQWRYSGEYTHQSTSTHLITFNAGEGSGTMAPMGTITGQPYEMPQSMFADPTEKFFVGWKIGNTGDTIIPGETRTTTAPLTLYAQYDITPVFYTISYNTGEVDGFVSSQIVPKGESAVIHNPASFFTIPEYFEFLGWNIDASAVILDPGDPFTPTASVTLVAVWNDTTPGGGGGDENGGSIFDFLKDLSFEMIIIIILILLILLLVIWAVARNKGGR
jgi:hypothetical protein